MRPSPPRWLCRRGSVRNRWATSSSQLLCHRVVLQRSMYRATLRRASALVQSAGGRAIRTRGSNASSSSAEVSHREWLVTSSVELTNYPTASTIWEEAHLAKRRGTGPVSPTVLTHARRRRVRHAEWRPRTSCLGRGPRLERAARIHHRRPARRGRPGGARPRACRRPLERSGLARPSGHREPGTIGCAQGRCRPRPSDRRRTPRRNRRDQPGRDRGAGVLPRAWTQRFAAPRPGHDRPGRRHGAVGPRRAPLRPREAALVRGERPTGWRRWPSWPGSSGVNPAWPPAPPPPPEDDSVPGPDLAAVRGQALGRRALEVAAARPTPSLDDRAAGFGKTMLAERLPVSCRRSAPTRPLP